MGDILTPRPPPPSLSLGSSTTGSWKLWCPGPTLRWKGHFSGKDLWQDGAQRGGSNRDSPPDREDPASAEGLWGRRLRPTRSTGPRACCRVPPVGRQERTLAPVSGQPVPAVPTEMPTWARLGTKPRARRRARPPLGQAGAGGAGCPPPAPWRRAGGGPGAWAGGSVLLRSLQHSLANAAAPGLQTPAPCRPPPPPPCPSSRPASFSCRPPPSARFHGNWAKLAQTASLPRTPGDARLLRGARSPPAGTRTLHLPGLRQPRPTAGRGDGVPKTLPPKTPSRLWKLRPFHMLPAGPENATKTISTCLIIYSHSITSQFQTFILRFFWVRPSVRCSSTISSQEIPYPFYRLETEAHSSKTTCLGIQGSWAPYWQPGLVILILVLLPQARAVPHTPQQTCTTRV